jgi:hypothetical protein
MNADAMFREHVATRLTGDDAHLTFEEAVADFPLDRINTRPPNVPYSFWGLLEHIRIAQWDILEFTKDPSHVTPPWPEGHWPEPDTEATRDEWSITLQAIRDGIAAGQAMARDSALDLLAPLGHAPQFSAGRELLLLGDHNSYHIGEFAILRQVMGLWPEGRVG